MKLSWDVYQMNNSRNQIFQNFKESVNFLLILVEFIKTNDQFSIFSSYCNKLLSYYSIQYNLFHESKYVLLVKILSNEFLILISQYEFLNKTTLQKKKKELDRQQQEKNLLLQDVLIEKFLINHIISY